MDKNDLNKLDEALKGIWDSLSEEQKAKAKACENLEELKKLAGKEGIELPDELLEAVAGGYIHYYNLHDHLCDIDIINDGNGKVEATLKNQPDDIKAKMDAVKMGFSPTPITDDELRALRGEPAPQPTKKNGC